MRSSSLSCIFPPGPGSAACPLPDRWQVNCAGGSLADVSELLTGLAGLGGDGLDRLADGFCGWVVELADACAQERPGNPRPR